MESVDFSSITTGDTFLNTNDDQFEEGSDLLLSVAGAGDTVPAAQTIYGRRLETFAMLKA
jgi:hypothetical protein